MSLCNAWPHTHTHNAYTHTVICIYTYVHDSKYIFRIHVPISTYYEHFHSIYGYVIIVCVYIYSYAVVSLIVSLLDNGIIQSALMLYDMWPLMSGSQSRKYFCFFSCLFHLWYCCKMGPATIALSQTLQIFIYLYIYIFIYIYICIYIHLYPTNRCCFQCFLGAEKYQKRGEIKKIRKKKKKIKTEKNIRNKIPHYCNPILCHFFFLKSKMLLHICNYNKVPFPSAPHLSLIAHLDISKEKHAQLKAEIQRAKK